MTREITRDISYASSASSRSGRALIRVMENATGRLSLIRRAAGYDAEVGQGREFWEVMVERYGLTLDLIAGSLDHIPREGPLIVVANHPYGILDGLTLGHILSTRRGDFRILANSVFRRAEELNRIVLPVSFDDTKEAIQQNIETRKTALAYLNEGGAIGVFPGGTVATAPKPFGKPFDPQWRGFTAKMIAKSKATVVPIFFEGHNSRLFQLASHLHVTLRMALLIKEFGKRVDAPVRLAVGAPIAPEEMRPHAHDPRALMDFLRATTYALSPRPLGDIAYGYEFEDRYRAQDGGRRIR
ncbi:Acyltransferase [Rhodobacteraceae bacterium THAF1]|uniref:lysophospholipid acyltransferase family protein n=1 Tax=Palleronia sp. THAF1 TaxID=2587842 RepID=UPI000F41418B|nr:lysophospholipid acyltransferase family protein [Palleronia sp. THAF1]QFU08216.1 Acyltransferase [Palleronia sp. THAF1]VDC28770.1 Acyltransferase [Rhodobacteraceae bacterium THAF1]